MRCIRINTDVYAVYDNLACIRMNKSANNAHEHRLARPIDAFQTDDLSRWNVNRYVIKDLLGADSLCNCINGYPHCYPFIW